MIKAPTGRYILAQGLALGIEVKLKGFGEIFV